MHSDGEEESKSTLTETHRALGLVLEARYCFTYGSGVFATVIFFVFAVILQNKSERDN